MGLAKSALGVAGKAANEAQLRRLAKLQGKSPHQVGSSTKLSSDEERYALLTGDFSKLNTKGKGGTNTGSTTNLRDLINKDRTGGPNDQFIIGGGMHTQAMVPFYNKKTGEVFHGSHGGWSAKEGSDWVQGVKPDN